MTSSYWRKLCQTCLLNVTFFFNVTTIGGQGYEPPEALLAQTPLNYSILRF